MARVGLIAGNGRFPFLVLDAAHAMGHGVVVIAVKEEADEDLEAAADRYGADVHRVSLGQLGKAIAILKKAGVTHTAHVYPGTQHGFHNDTTPRYDAAAARLAWTRTIELFERTLRAPAERD